jgi:hypothetical protein
MVTTLVACSALAVSVAYTLVGCEASTSQRLCTAVGSGPTARAAVESYLRRCGSDYTISGKPENGHKDQTGYPNYARLVGYFLNVTLEVLGTRNQRCGLDRPGDHNEAHDVNVEREQGSDDPPVHVVLLTCGFRPWQRSSPAGFPV